MDLEKIIKTKSNRKILQFFNEHQNCIDSANGIAIWTGLSLDTTKKSLKTLQKHNIIVEHKTNSTAGYSYTQNQKLIKDINRTLDKIINLLSELDL